MGNDDIAKKIGDKIRTIRKQKNLTLKELAGDSGISTSMLSKIETAQTLPPVSTYANIASGLGMSFGELFQIDTEEPDISIVRSGDKQVISRGPYIGSPLAYQKKEKCMEPFLFEYPAMETIPVFRHDYEEMLFIIEGKLEFRYGEEIIILEKGDCIYFNGKIPHGGRALGSKVTKALVVQSSN
jgi:transcriptional regulator with XRE-family HTH domain